MTTSVTIDAHAGWDIELITTQKTVEELFEQKVIIIPAKTKHTEYIWEDKRITSIRELPR